MNHSEAAMTPNKTRAVRPAAPVAALALEPLFAVLEEPVVVEMPALVAVVVTSAAVATLYAVADVEAPPGFVIDSPRIQLSITHSLFIATLKIRI